MNKMARNPNFYIITTISIFLVGGTLSVSPQTPELSISGYEANPVLFIHGWMGTSSRWFDMIEMFKDDGWSENLLFAYTFEDINNCSIEANINNANDIKGWVDQILLDTGKSKIDLIGHSMGGLSSRYYIKYLGGNETVDDYVSLVSPQHGTTDASCGFDGNNDFVLLLNKGDETPYGILDDTIGFRQDPYFPDRNYTGVHIPGEINYTSIYIDAFDGSFDGTDTSPLDGAYNVIFKPVGIRNHLYILSQDLTYNLIQPAIDGPFNFTTPTTTISDTPVKSSIVIWALALIPLSKRK